MADWFETRFREPTGGHPDPAFAARVRALVVEEWREDVGWTPSGDTHAHDHEGDVIMLETEDRPPLADTPTPRRPPGRWLLVAAAVALLAVIGAVLAAGGEDEEKIDTAPVAPTAPQPRDILVVSEGMSGDDTLEPGSYFIDPDGDPTTPLRVVYDIAAEGWGPWIGAAKFKPNDTHIGLTITTVTNLTRDACHDQQPMAPPVGPTVDDLATALTQLAPFEVTSPPTDVTRFGYSGKHVQLTVPADLPAAGNESTRRFVGCGDDGTLHSWYAPNLGGSYWGYNGEPGRWEDFWILDVDGTRLVIQTNAAPKATAQDLAELEAILDSIRIQP